VSENLASLSEKNRVGAEQWIVLAAAFLGWMFDGLEMGLFPIAARPALQDLMSYTNAAGELVLPPEGDVGAYYSWLVAMFLLGAAAGGWIFGWLGDNLGRVKAMALSIAVYAGFTGCCAFATAPWHLAAFRLLAALGMGGEWALGVALVMESWPDKYRPVLAGVIGSAANVGLLCISILGASIAVTMEQWRWIMVAGAAPALLAILIVFFIPESKKWKATMAEGLKVDPLREVFSPALAKRTILGILLASVAFIGTWAAVSAFLPLWVDQMAGEANPTDKGLIQSIIAIGAIIGCFIGPILARALNRRISYVLLCVGSLACCQYLFRAFSADNYLDEKLAFFVVTGFAGLLTAAFYGWLPLYFSELFPTRVRATGQGIAFNSGRVFAAAGVLLSGQLIKNVFDGQYSMACATITFVYVIGMIVIAFAPETKGQPLPD
jgi:MFS family permease